MRSLVPVLVSDRQFRRLPTTKTIWLASLLLEPQKPSEKCGILMLKENIGHLATCFKTLNGTTELSQPESLRQLKMFIHQQSSTIMFHCFFGENLSEFEIAWKVISLLLELLHNVMKQKDEAFAKVVWIQIANLIKIVQFRCGSKFTVLATNSKISDQWRREDPGNREASQLTGIRKIKRKRKIRDLKTLKVKNPKRPKHQRQHGVIENRTLFN